MSDNICSNCGAPFAEGDASCHECGMPHEVRAQRQPQKERLCGGCGVIAQPGDLFCEQCGADLAKFAVTNEGSNTPTPVDVPVKFHGAPVKEKVVLATQTPNTARGRAPLFTQTFVPTRKRPGKNSSMPRATVALIALLVLAGLGLGAYKFLSAGKDSDLLGDNPIDFSTDLDPVFPDQPPIDDPAPETTIARPVTPETQPGGIPSLVDSGPIKYVWGVDDPRGYSSLAPSDPSRIPSETPFLAGVVAGDRVRLRSEPNTSSTVLSHSSKGAKIEVIGRFTSGVEKFPWYNIRALDKVGWMYGEYVNIIEN
ncbi:MAG: SH3 domain-containing protein [Synergistaceae bacterium]|jgi:uncharacterized protein YgiM (DUF1202 family)|nr:SH3 domain-containing protein [Synergistaceae bacterium]